MTQEFKEGDHVEYHPIGGGQENTATTTGTIKKILTEKQPAGETGVQVNASDDEPRYLIENDKTGKETAYKKENIIGKA